MIAPLMLTDIAQETAGTLHGTALQITRVTTDSRAVQTGDLFVALKGERFDGNDFVADVAKAGAAAVVVSRYHDVSIPQIVVADTLHALGAIARLNRRRFAGKLVALTGSAGKTTTKDMISSVLAQAGTVLSTGGNFNNEIGVPLTLLQIDASHHFAVIEMGAAKPGDIAYLMQFVEPDVVLLTNASAAHLKGFGSEDVVARTKGEIFSASRSDATAVINLDSPYAQLWRGSIGTRRMIGFALEDVTAQVRAESIESKDWGSRFTLQMKGLAQIIELRVPGRHNIANALAAAAVAQALDLPMSAVRHGLEQFTGSKARLQRKTGISGCTLIDDTYNANPSSMASAIAVLASQHAPRVLVMGDMGELGDVSEAEHRRLLTLAESSAIETIFLFGDHFADVAASARRARLFTSQADIVCELKPQLTHDHSVLVKGSHYMRMDAVIDALIQDNEGES